MRTTGRRLIGYDSISVSQYSNGETVLLHMRMDDNTRRMIPRQLEEFEELQTAPLHTEEMLLMAALEVWARWVDPHGELF